MVRRDVRSEGDKSPASRELDSPNEGVWTIARMAEGIVTDITAQLEAAESVAESERFFRSMIENSMVSVAVVDAQTRYTYVSPNVLPLLGYHHDELRGRSPFDFLHPDDMSTGHAAIEQACSAPGAVSFARVRFLHKDGSWRWIDASVRNLLHDDVVHGIVLNWHDVTERYQAEQALRQSEEKLRQAQKIEAIGRLAGGIAHDFNNLLTAILTTAQLSAMDAPEGSALRSDLGEIHQAAERAAGLTRQLLAFSRRQVLRPRTVDLALVVADLEKMLVRLIGEDVGLTSLIEPNCNVRADPGQLEQVIMNLALNARDAMPRGGRLTLRTDKVDLEVEDGRRMFGGPGPRGPYVRLQVEDSGLGMDESTLQHIFEPFFTTKELGKGTGLGLATVYGIVKQSRAHITVYSEPAKGTTFKIYFPSLDKAIPLSRSLPLAAAPKGEGTVLLVEDEPSLRVLAAESLRKLGYTVLQAGNGLEAIAVADGHAGRINIVVTDVVMPRLGGPELVARLREKRDGFSVIFMSGYTEAGALENSKIGPDAVLLNKPFSTEVLARKISEVQQNRSDGVEKRLAAAASAASAGAPTR